MSDYALVLLPVCLMGLAASLLAVDSQRIVARVLVLMLTCFAALRGYVGTDTGAYHTMFFDFGSLDLTDLANQIEPVFAALLHLTAQVSDSSFLFVGSIAVLQGVLLVLVVGRHEQPALFVAVYASTFFVNFHFNILRAGVAALFLVLALASLRSSQRARFQGFGFLSILSHYSSVLFFLPMNLVGRRWYIAVLSFVLASLAAIGLMMHFVNEARYFQYLTYVALLETSDSVSYGFGLLALFALYVGVFVLTVSRSNYHLLLPLMCLWIALRLASNHMLFVSRIEVVVNLFLLYILLGESPPAQRRAARLLVCALLVSLNLYGTIGGLKAADQSMREGFAADPSRRNSTYLPYRFAWEE